MPRILHTADIHLDSPFSLLDVKKARERKEELREVFLSSVRYARDEKIDIFCIAGDLFDTGFATPETAELIAEAFSEAPDCRFVISPGNHDFYSPKSVYAKTVFPDNVYIFKENEINMFSFPEINTDVYGFAYTSADETANPLSKPLLTDKRKFNLLVCHADIYDAGTGNFSVSEADIAKSGCDYAALGHIHAGSQIKLSGGTYYGYCGCPEGRSFDECGKKTAVLCELSGRYDDKKTVFSRVGFSVREFMKTEADVTGLTSAEQTVEKLREAAKALGAGGSTQLRVTLTGVVSPDANLRTDRIRAEDIGVYYLEIKNEALPLLSYKELKLDPSVKGAFFRELLPKLKSEDERERRIAALALRYGFTALAGNDVTDF